MPTDRKLFFVHLMKTGGASFRARLRSALGDESVYPSAIDGDLFESNTFVANMVGLTDERRATIDAYAGHFPFVATQMIADEVWTATVVREPVGRTVSLLKHTRRYEQRFADAPLEAIYDDPVLRPTLIENYQAKLFSMTEDDSPESQLDTLQVDEDRLALACLNLERVDVVGVHERYDDFVDEMSARTGWEFDRVGRWRPGEDDAVDVGLLARIAADNEMDARFHRFAADLVAARAD